MHLYIRIALALKRIFHFYFFFFSDSESNFITIMILSVEWFVSKSTLIYLMAAYIALQLQFNCVEIRVRYFIPIKRNIFIFVVVGYAKCWRTIEWKYLTGISHLAIKFKWKIERENYWKICGHKRLCISNLIK